jgi:predicted nucleotidyltransferase component of viral defense system
VRVSKEKLILEAEATGFRVEILEKAIHLLALLEGFRSHPFLKNRWVLKGGTAFNLFVLRLPRLSVDIDLNYIGAAEQKIMLEERPKIEEAVQAVCAREGFVVRRIPEKHAGGKWSLRYESALGPGGNLEIDLNFMFRVPLWSVVTRDSQTVGSYQASGIPVLDIHELAAGKLAALLSRHQPRDLFDVAQITSHRGIERNRLRTAFVVYGAMNRKDWRKVSVEDIRFDARELDYLVPLPRREAIKDMEPTATLGDRLVEQCRNSSVPIGRRVCTRSLGKH